jgi:hypothetical protein
MPGTHFENDADGYDEQDQSEVFDESMTTGGEGSVGLGGDSPLGVGAEMRTFEELPDVEDLTQLAGDRDDDEALALDADEFDPDAVGDEDFEEDDELDYRAATEERQSDLDGLGAEDSFDEGRVARSEIDGLEEVRDADEAEGGEDDFTDLQSRGLDDEDLKNLGYSEERDGRTLAKPDR